VVGSAERRSNMHWMKLILVSTIALLSIWYATADCGSALLEKRARIIPLASVWAHDMPRTRNIRELEPNNFGEPVRNLPSDEKARRLRESLITQIQRSLRASTRKGWGRCFAVVGTGKEALEHAYEVLVKEKTPSRSFRPTDELSIVFYSNEFGRAVQLQHIAIDDNAIEIQYAFVPHRETFVSSHFALIPIGQLPSGVFDVQVREALKEHRITPNESRTHDRTSRVVCKPCKFSVTEGGSDFRPNVRWHRAGVSAAECRCGGPYEASQCASRACGVATVGRAVLESYRNTQSADSQCYPLQSTLTVRLSSRPKPRPSPKRGRGLTHAVNYSFSRRSSP
jgi:hypothetical protein